MNILLFVYKRQKTYIILHLQQYSFRIKRKGSRMYSVNGFAFMLLCICISIGIMTARRTNCAIGNACDKCGSNSKIITRYNIKVCCSSCSAEFKAYNLANGRRGYCNCYERKLNSISGDCWKGSQCANCGNSTGSINGVPVCCANCEQSGMALSPSSCNCLHNGP
ncbi:hypothetical protein KUTeg_019501 [Tegillarca granosa]|uniref:Uncharacterized protein n=1 Tax=Tegillarca granosa TaxID=220873 RepID=A0ABQ9EI66_TEGGR|nr:hypothetical protein KUTeg_019501 [Tegillarca granosa]